jgi:hypothetical protein
MASDTVPDKTTVDQSNTRGHFIGVDKLMIGQ